MYCKVIVNRYNYFYSEGEPDDFCIEISLFAARTDQGLVDSGGSLRSKITRSLGRKFGTTVVTSFRNDDDRFL